MMHERMVVDDSGFFKLRDQLFGCRPCWRGVALWLLAAEFGQDVDGACEDGFLLFGGEFGDVFVGVAVETDFVAGVADFGHLLWEGFD